MFFKKKQRSNMMTRFVIDVEKDYYKPEYRAQALKIVNSERGIDQVAVEKNEAKNIRLIIIGKGVDSVTVTRNLRRQMGAPATLVEQNVVMEEQVMQEPQAEVKPPQPEVQPPKRGVEPPQPEVQPPKRGVEPPQPGIHWSPSPPPQGGGQWLPGRPVEIYEVYDPNPGGCTIL